MVPTLLEIIYLALSAPDRRYWDQRNLSVDFIEIIPSSAGPRPCWLMISEHRNCMHVYVQKEWLVNKLTNDKLWSEFVALRIANTMRVRQEWKAFGR